MANLHDCIQRAMDAKELDTTRGRAILSEYDQLVARYEQAMPRHQAEATAAANLKEATSKARLSRRHKVLNQLQSMQRIRNLVETSDDPLRAVRALLAHQEGFDFKGENVQALSDAMMRSVNAGLNDVMRTTGRNIFGNSREKVMLRDLMRELHLQDSGNAKAKVMADAVRHQQRRMRQMFNAHGGDIGALDDFGVSHSHDTAQIRKAGFDAWSQTVALKLDWSRITDFKTGKPFASAAGAMPRKGDADAFLKDVYDGITTRGWDTREPSLTVGGKALYNRHAEHRVLHFKDGDAWLEYNKEFGTSDPFSAMIGGLHGMAREVAQMRVLGPNPRMGLEYASQVARKKLEMAGDQKMLAKADQSAKRARTLLAHVDGSVSAAESERWARFFGGVRNTLTATQLGAAILSTPTDLVTISHAAAAVGMRPTNVLSKSVQLMSSSATRETAARMGYVADTLASTGQAAARFTGDVISGEFTGRLSDFVMRASGLSFWTDMNRTAFKMEFSGFLADNADRVFADIDAPLRKLFEQRGITPKDWDLLRDVQTQFVAPNGANFITPQHWLEHQDTLPRVEAEGLAMRLQMAIEEQMEFAVPTANVEMRAVTIQNNAPGSFMGELARSVTMYKSFGLSLFINQYRRFMSLPSPLDKAKYAATMASGLLLMGGLAIQLKEMSKGNDPRPMNTLKFWGAAQMQGGGFSIFGDFLASETNRFGGGLAETIAGPVVSLGSSIIKPVASNARRLAEGKDSLLGRDAANFLRYNTPVASSLWYQRLAFDRLVADQVQSFLDPEAETLWKKQMRKKAKDYGTSTFWDRGALAPSRLPNFSNVVGGS